MRTKRGDILHVELCQCNNRNLARALQMKLRRRKLPSAQEMENLKKSKNYIMLPLSTLPKKDEGPFHVFTFRQGHKFPHSTF